LITERAARSGADGTGSLLDLVCGTRQLSFALHEKFAETWAVDQESRHDAGHLREGLGRQDQQHECDYRTGRGR
jgi:hypothetical protein